MFDYPLAFTLSSDQVDLAIKQVEDGTGYLTHSVRKRSGERRKVYEPKTSLRTILKITKMAMDESGIYSPPPGVFGYVRGRSTLGNAQYHLGAEALLSVDLTAFFESISSDRLGLSLIDCGVSEQVAAKLVRLCCVNGALRAGFPTSPILSNVAFRATDLTLNEFARVRGLSYSRYADDITLSGPHEDVGDDLLADLRSKLLAFDWKLNDKKSRFMRRGGPQYVTGLSVSDPTAVRAPARVKSLLRMHLYYIEKFGHAECRSRNPSTPSYWWFAGWVGYLRVIEPTLGAQLQAKLDTAFGKQGPKRDGLEWLDLLQALGATDLT